MEEVEVIFGEVTFGVAIFEVDIIIEQTEVGKIGGHGDNLGQEKEKEEVGHHLVLDQDQELVQIEIGLGVSNVESMTTLQMNVLIWSLITQIGKVIMQDQDIMNGIDIKSIDYREHKRMYRKMGKEGGKWLDIRKPGNYEKQIYGCI